MFNKTHRLNNPIEEQSLFRRRTSWKGRIVLILFGLIAGLLAAEIALRLGGISYPKFYQADASRGYSPRPGMEGWYEFEGRAYVRINSDGLRDRERSKTKPPNTFRIAVLGDSYAEAFQVPLEEGFCSVMESRLRECLGLERVEVINFGVSGYGTSQELITLRERVWQYSPDRLACVSAGE